MPVARAGTYRVSLQSSPLGAGQAGSTQVNGTVTCSPGTLTPGGEDQREEWQFSGRQPTYETLVGQRDGSVAIAAIGDTPGSFTPNPPIVLVPAAPVVGATFASSFTTADGDGTYSGRVTGQGIRTIGSAHLTVWQIAVNIHFQQTNSSKNQLSVDYRLEPHRAEPRGAVIHDLRPDNRLGPSRCPAHA